MGNRRNLDKNFISTTKKVQRRSTIGVVDPLLHQVSAQFKIASKLGGDGVGKSTSRSIKPSASNFLPLNQAHKLDISTVNDSYSSIRDDQLDHKHKLKTYVEAHPFPAPALTLYRLV